MSDTGIDSDSCHSPALTTSFDGMSDSGEGPGETLGRWRKLPVSPVLQAACSSCPCKREAGGADPDCRLHNMQARVALPETAVMTLQHLPTHPPSKPVAAS